ncbi:MAG TPA: amino acid racemase [Pyrinomonadaceae bacterium]|nr:amino acid racemase [Pyrinomonadaceae bacterium]
MQALRGGDCLGILGGMGPVASAEFLKTVYEQNLGEREQTAPKVVMLSDPSCPDRTEAFLAGRADEVLRQLTANLRRLSDLGATRIVICCVTMHHLLPALEPDLRARIVSLLDVVFDRLERSGRRHLLICSSGTRRLGLFEKHERWPAAAPHVVLPGEADQQVIHRDLIYPMKTDPDVSKRVPLLRSLLKRYGVGSFIAGCTEMHMLAKRPELAAGVGCIDPLAVVARGLQGETL